MIVFLVILAGGLGVVFWFWTTAEEDKTIQGSNDGLLRGTAFVPTPVRKTDLDITLGGVPICDEAASKHVALAGPTGTGKTTGIIEAVGTMIRRVDVRGDLLIVIDNRGELMSKFGRQGDTILNPFDTRTAAWSPFPEVFDPRIDFRMLAKSLYPQKANSQPEWDDFAKNLMSNILMRLHSVGRPDPAEFLRLATIAPKEELEDFLKGTSSSISASAENSRMFASIRSTLSSSLDAWWILPGNGEFSIRKWVREPGGAVLWIPYMPQHRASLEYLIAGWIDLAIQEILSLGESRERKIWLLIDEVTAIGKIPSIIDGLTLGRKPGLSVWMGFQSIAQLKGNYGDNDAQTLVGNARSKLVLAQGSHLDADFWANELGKKDWIQEETSENQGSSTNLRTAID